MTIDDDIGIKMIEDGTCWNLSKLLRLYLVQPTAVDAPFAAKLVPRHLTKQSMNGPRSLGIRPKHLCQSPSQIEHEIQVCADGP